MPTLGWTPEIAYAVGLLATDGNLSSDGRHISLTSSDTQQLENFRKCLAINVKLTSNPPGSFTRNPSYRVQFGSRELYRWLQDIGLTPRKTASLGALKIPARFFSDFLRGVIDGDGSIITYPDRYNVYKGKCYEYLRLYVAIASSSHKFLKWIQQTLQQLLSVRGSLVLQPNRREGSKPSWKLRFAKNDSVKLLRWIYYSKNVPCLGRKRIIAEKALEAFSLFQDKRLRANKSPKNIAQEQQAFSSEADEGVSKEDTGNFPQNSLLNAEPVNTVLQTK